MDLHSLNFSIKQYEWQLLLNINWLTKNMLVEITIKLNILALKLFDFRQSDQLILQL